MKPELEKIFITDEVVEMGYQRLLGKAEDTVAMVATLERRGGPCPICGVQFNLVIVDNKFGCFNYYQPSCRCFKRCEVLHLPGGRAEGCGRWLIVEGLTGINRCTSCLPIDPFEKKTKIVKGRPTARKISGKDLATGEKEDS